MRTLHKTWLGCLAAVTLFVGGAAGAQDDGAQTSSTGASATDDLLGRSSLIGGKRFGVLTSMDTSVLRVGGIGAGGFNASIMGEFPGVLGVLNLDQGLQLGAGLGFEYDGNGNATSFAGSSGDDVTFGLLLHAAYFVKNTERMAYGPELQFVTQVVNPFDYVSFQPGFAFWFRPWDVPILLGGAVAGRLVIQDGPDPVFGLVSPNLRFLWILN